MKSFIINTAKGAVISFKKNEVRGKLMGKEWKMLSDEPSITAKYIFLNDGKLLLSVNGLSTYSTWQMATESSLIMDEGVATFLYKVVHIDKNIVVLNLDGTDNYCFLINDASQSLAKATFEDIQWHLYRHCNMDILSEAQKVAFVPIQSVSPTQDPEKANYDDVIVYITFIIILLVGIVIFFIYMVWGI